MEKDIKQDNQSVAGIAPRPTVLVVEDDAGLNLLIRKTLEREGIIAHQALNGAEGIAAAGILRYSIILLDYCLPDMNGKHFVKELAAKELTLPVIVITGNGDERIAVEMLKLGVRDYLIKEPDFISKIPRTIKRTIGEIVKEQELAYAEESLRKSEEKFKAIANYTVNWESWFSPVGKYLWVNPAVERFTGFTAEEILAMPDFIPVLIDEQDRPMFIERFNGAIKGSSGENFEFRYVHKNGSRSWLSVSWHPIYDSGGRSLGVRASGRDITERKKAEEKQKILEEQLRQSQKLEAIGQLSSGVAHDFNNLLGGIMGHAELLKMRFEKDSPLMRHTDGIISCCTKAADLTRQLLSFARKAPVEFRKFEMNGFLRQVKNLLDRTIDRRIEIVAGIPDQPAYIYGDCNLLENALLNIAINARDAMPDGGRLKMTAETVDLGKNALTDGYAGSNEDAYVKISIVDTGTGMPREVKDRIFEPFFTTKEMGKGTGLGLASVYGCVKQHDGYIEVESWEGKGTRFDIYLPAVKSPEAIMAVERKDAAIIQGKGSLLVVDDEPVYHEILAEIFGKAGYAVHCCSGGDEAVAYYREHSTGVDIVILDMNMPQMNGLQCFRLLREINRGVKVVVASGYGDNSDRQTMLKEGVRTFVQKPFRAADLSEKIKEVMASS